MRKQQKKRIEEDDDNGSKKSEIFNVREKDKISQVETNENTRNS